MSESCYDLLVYQIVDEMMNKRCVGRSKTEKDKTAKQLEEMGYLIGYKMAEFLSKDMNRIVDTLDIIKFLCKDVWNAVYRKSVDKLSTDHKGVYVIEDTRFRLLLRLSGSNEDDVSEEAIKYLILPCGIIRGVLGNMGIKCSVKAEAIHGGPHCQFNIKML